MKAAVGVHVTLQNEDRGHLVDDGLAGAGGAGDSIEMPMGLGRAEPFVPQMDGDAQFGLEGGRKILGGKGAWAGCARHVQGESNDDGGAPITADDAGERAQVIAAVGASQGQQRLGGEAQFI